MKRMKYNDSDYTPTDIEIVAQEFTGGVQSSTDHLQIIYTEYLINKSALCFKCNKQDMCAYVPADGSSQTGYYIIKGNSSLYVEKQR